MQILDLLGMYFDAVVVFVTNSSFLYIFTLHIDLSSSDLFHITTLTACTTLQIQPFWL
jgi:hypothetical protein